MRTWHVVTVLALVSGQVTAGGIATVVMLMVAPTIAAASSHNILVGPGFTDVSPHQIVRTAADRLYAVVPTCDAYPACPNNTLRVFKANQAGTPTSFTEQDVAHRPPAGVGSSAIALDGANNIHIVWNDRNGALNYRTFATATDRWSATTTIAATNWTNFGQGDEGVALALDAAGIPHVAFTAIAANIRRVAYVDKIGGSWSTPMLVDDAPFGTNQGALHPTLAFYPNGNLLLAWLVGSFNYTPDGAIFFRTRDHLSASWGTRTTIVGDTLMTTIDNGPSLLITADGTAHVAFLNAGMAANGNGSAGNYIHYYFNGGGGWVANHPGGGMQISHDPSLGPGMNGSVRIYSHGWQGGPIDGHGNDLYYFEGSGRAAPWGAWTLFVTGSYDSSVTTRWAQFFQAHAEELDIAYWADAYPNMLYVGTDVTVAPPQPASLPQPRGAQTGIIGLPAVLPPTRGATAATPGLPNPLPSRR
jgi:hypothetical protein